MGLRDLKHLEPTESVPPVLDSAPLLSVKWNFQEVTVAVVTKSRQVSLRRIAGSCHRDRDFDVAACSAGLQFAPCCLGPILRPSILRRIPHMSAFFSSRTSGLESALVLFDPSKKNRQTCLGPLPMGSNWRSGLSILLEKGSKREGCLRALFKASFKKREPPKRKSTDCRVESWYGPSVAPPFAEYGPALKPGL